MRMFEFGSALNDRGIYVVKMASIYQRLEVAAGEERLPTVYGFHQPPFQAIVSWVCRLWRNISISTPSLWTDIRVHIFHYNKQLPLKFVSLQLERSKQLPIDISVHAGENATLETNLSDTKLLYSLLLTHVHRWRSIDISSQNPPDHLPVFLDAASDPSITSAPHLTSLRIRYTHGVLRVDDREFPVLRGFHTLFNGSAPRLTHVLLHAVPVGWSQTWISAASNLTTLELFVHFEEASPSWAEFATILRGATELKKLSLYDSAPAGSPDENWFIGPSETNATNMDPNAPIQLLQLTDLFLGALAGGLCVALLWKLCMPALKTLMLDLGMDYYDEFVTELIATMVPSSIEGPPHSLLSQLERLAILELRCEEDNFIADMFDQLENVKTLRLGLSDEELPRRFLLNLLFPLPSTDDNLCGLPRLESLFVCPSKRNLAHLGSVVQRRMDIGAPLKALYVSSDEYCDMERQDKEWFRKRVEKLGCASEMDLMDTDRAFQEEWMIPDDLLYEPLSGSD